MEILIARDAGRRALPLADARALRFLTERIEGPQLGVPQVTKVKRSLPHSFLRCDSLSVKPAPLLCFGPRQQRPAYLLRVGEDAGLDGFVFDG